MKKGGVYRELSQRRGRRQQERQKALGLIGKTTTLRVHHTFLYISLSLMHDYDVKFPQATFYGGRKHKTTSFSFNFNFNFFIIMHYLHQLQLVNTKILLTENNYISNT